MKAMILAAGFGTRLFPLTIDRTKPAIPFLGKPLVGYVAEYVARYGFKDFIVNQACDIVQLDVRNTGGLLESKKIADLAHTFNLPMTAHNTGSLICVMATAQWAASVRDFIAAESVLGKGDWMDNIVVREGPLYKDGYYTLPDKPGLGVELNRQVVEAHLAPGEKWWG